MKKLLFFLFFSPFYCWCQNSEISYEKALISKYIKSSYKKTSELLTTNQGCFFLNKDSSLFTGKAYIIEYISDYYFIGSSTDSSVCRVKIMEFKNGLRNGISKIIDPFYGHQISKDNYGETEQLIELESNLYLPDSLNLKEQVVFIFNNYDLQQGDLSEYVSFSSHSFYDLNGEKLDVETNILGDDWSMKKLASDKYLNKYLKLTLQKSLGKTGEQYGHFASDEEMFYYSVPPYYCGKSINISNIEIIKDFKIKDQ
jgi:hypothetical protein